LTLAEPDFVNNAFPGPENWNEIITTESNVKQRIETKKEKKEKEKEMKKKEKM